MKKLFRLLRKAAMLYLLATDIPAAFYLSAQGCKYLLSSHHFGPAPIVGQLFPKAPSGLDGAFTTLDLTKGPPTRGDFWFVCLTAIEAHPTLINFGHAYVTFVHLTVNSSKAVHVCEYDQWGFRPGSSRLSPQQQKAIEQHARQLLPPCTWETVHSLATFGYAAMARDEGAPESAERDQVSRNQGKLDYSPSEARDLQGHFLFGTRAGVVVVCSVSDRQYSEAKKLCQAFLKKDYLILGNDCASFVNEVATSIGLYTPSRLIAPLPGDYIQRLATFNQK